MRIFTNSRMLWTIHFVIVVCYVCIPAYAQYSGGTGEPNDPYQIATAEDLILLGEMPEDYDKHFIMTADIDLASYLFDRAVIAPDVNDDEDRFQGTAFTGIFDGNGHTVSHLTIESDNYLGLFGNSGGTISNLGLEVVDVNGTGSCVGGLVGFNSGSITMSYSTGSVSGTSSVGGLVGGNRGSITMSYSTGSVMGGRNVGGLVGCNENPGHITSSYSTGSVIGAGSVGGLVGCTEGYIISCYSTGSVSGSGHVGGLIGNNDGTIMLTSSFWDMETSGQTISGGGFGLTTSEMMDPEILGLNGLLVNDPNWVLDAGNDYPRLAWEGTPGQMIPEPVIDWMAGQGNEQEPYRIDTADQLILLGRARILWDKHFILTEDIDLDPSLPGRRVFSQAFIQSFDGVFDGNGHVISNLHMLGGGRFLGLFGGLGSGATISNLGLEAVDLNSTYRWKYYEAVGGLAGYNAGVITACYSTGMVNGNLYVGGLVGDNRGSITNCYSPAMVIGSEYVGGLAGRNRDSITNCYSTGLITGNNNVGGLVGDNEYDVVSSFWDIESSGQAESDGGTGLTTAEMQTATTFLDAGWNFVDETVNGPNDIWTICEGTNYPRFVWQIPWGDFLCPDGITMEDFDFFMDHYENTNCDSSNSYCDGTDLDFSGTVDINDFAILLDNWLKENP